MSEGNKKKKIVSIISALFLIIIIIFLGLQNGNNYSDLSQQFQNNVSPKITYGDEENIIIEYSSEGYERDSNIHYISKQNTEGKIIDKPQKVKEKYNFEDAFDYHWVRIDEKLNAYIFYFEDVFVDWDIGPRPSIGEKIYISKIDKNSNIIFNKVKFPTKTDNLYNPETEFVSIHIRGIHTDNESNLHIISEYWIHDRDWSGYHWGGWYVNLHYSKISKTGDILIDDIRLTNNDRSDYEKSIIDTNGTINIIYESSLGLVYLPIDLHGNNLCQASAISNNKHFTNITIGYADYGYDELVPITRTLFENSKGQLISLSNSLKADSNNNFHLVYGKGNSCGGEDAHLVYRKYNQDGDVIIDNITIVTHKKRIGYDHGPGVFDPNFIIDKDDNLHIVWYINIGSNSYEAYYTKLDNNGNVLIEERLIEHDINSFSIIRTSEFLCCLSPLIIVVILLIIDTIYIFRMFRKKK